MSIRSKTVIVLLAMSSDIGLSAPALAQGAITKKAQQMNQAKENRRIMLETVDRDQDGGISQAEFHEAYLAVLVDSPRIKKQDKNIPIDPQTVSVSMFDLVDLNKDARLDKKEVEEALLQGVLLFKYHYVPTAEEKTALEAARQKALANPEIRTALDEAAAWRAEAAVKWDDPALKKKAQEATLKSTKNLHREMIRIDPAMKELLDKLTDTKP